MVPFPTVEAAILHRLLVPSPAPTGCSDAACNGEYVWRTSHSQVLPPILICYLPGPSAISSSSVLRPPLSWTSPSITLGGAVYDLVGVCCRSPTHYFTRLHIDDAWFDHHNFETGWFHYDDLESRAGELLSVSADRRLARGFYPRAVVYVAQGRQGNRLGTIPVDLSAAWSTLPEGQKSAHHQSSPFSIRRG